MARRATVENLGEAMEIVKEMNATGDKWENHDLRAESRNALKKVLEGRMSNRMDVYLTVFKRQGGDRRNGSYSRNLMTVLGEIELVVPRSRKFSALSVVKWIASSIVN